MCRRIQRTKRQGRIRQAKIAGAAISHTEPNELSASSILLVRWPIVSRRCETPCHWARLAMPKEQRTIPPCHRPKSMDQFGSLPYVICTSPQAILSEGCFALSRCNRQPRNGFLPPPNGPRLLPLTPGPARAYKRTAIRKDNPISFSSECPRFRQRSGRGGKNPSRVSAALR